MSTTNTTEQNPCGNIPQPGPEHAWLQRFVGEWESDCMITMDPSQEPMQALGTETCRQLGGFWIVSQGRSDFMGSLFESVLTLGYNTNEKKYVGTWVDSMTGYLWKYTGEVEGEKLTLMTEGYNHKKPGTKTSFREVTEFKTPDHRTFESSMQEEDGSWSTCVRVDYRRKKS